MDVTFTCLSPENSKVFEEEYDKHKVMNQHDYNESLLSFSDPMFTLHQASVMKDGYTNNTFITLCCDEEFSGVTVEATYVNVLVKVS